MEQIKSELLNMRLPGMAGALQTLQESRKIHELSFTDGLRLLIQAERDQKGNKPLQEIGEERLVPIPGKYRRAQFRCRQGVGEKPYPFPCKRELHP